MKLADILRNIKETKGKEYIENSIKEQFNEIKNQTLIIAEKGKNEYIYYIPEEYLEENIIFSLINVLKKEGLKANYNYINGTILIKW